MLRKSDKPCRIEQVRLDVGLDLTEGGHDLFEPIDLLFRSGVLFGSVCAGQVAEYRFHFRRRPVYDLR